MALTSIVFFVLLIEMASKDDGEAQHTIVAKEGEQAGYAIMVNTKEVVEAGSVANASYL